MFSGYCIHNQLSKGSQKFAGVGKKLFVFVTNFFTFNGEEGGIFALQGGYRTPLPSCISMNEIFLWGSTPYARLG